MVEVMARESFFTRVLKARSRGAALTLAAVAAVLIAGCQSPKPKSAPPVRKTTTKVTTKVTRKTTTPATREPAKKPAAILVTVEFHGAFTFQADTRRVSYSCSGCKKQLASVRVPKCPQCAARLSWPGSVKCGLCQGQGKCSTCKGSGKCPSCGGGRRMLMGVRPACDVCNNSDKCAACGGKSTCTFCNNGWHTPGKAASNSGKQPAIPRPKP
jgi:hypothetical protein